MSWSALATVRVDTLQHGGHHPPTMQYSAHETNIYWTPSHQPQVLHRMSQTPMTMPSVQAPAYAAPLHHKLGMHERHATRSKRIAITDLVNPTGADQAQAIPAPTSPEDITSPDSTRSALSYKDWNSHYAPPRQHFTSINRPPPYTEMPGVVSFRQHTSGGTHDYREWTMPKQEAQAASRPARGEGASDKPLERQSPSSGRSMSSSPAASLTSLSPLIPPPIHSARTTRAAEYDFSLTFRQQPQAARACGLGDRDRRTIDPPPILELKVTEKSTGYPAYDLDATLVLHCQLRDVNGRVLTDMSLGADSSRPVSAMMGNYVASPFRAKDERGIAGTFFILSDLSCRYPERYRLHFQLLRLDCQTPGHVPATALSEPFTVYTAKDFPGMRESTPLLKQLRRQGLSVGLKKGSEARKMKSKIRKLSPSLDADGGADEEMGHDQAGLSDHGSPSYEAAVGQKRRMRS